ncbi:putative membrane protein [Apostasia shenzhenica]|uniref:Putative membrane protein n=1 Tax=Apostasia shenzhenica TaxID=1088818 RepID=A0A2I0B065_9ASPA|nr:putative membrane protein [Apostasia shenzhenica]
MLSYHSFRYNESILFTGHADGSIASHRLWESAANGEDLLTLTLASSRSFARGSRDLESPPVLSLEVHQVGRIRYVLVADGGGRIRVFTENGTLYGTAIASSCPLAFMRQRLLFLTASGAGSLDLRSMSVKEIECDGWNGSLAKSFSFDGSERSNAYGVTNTGDLIHVVLLGDVTNLKCRVRTIRKAEIDGPKTMGVSRFAGDCTSGHRQSHTGTTLEQKSNLTNLCSQIML